jgi:hypothetical protein
MYLGNALIPDPNFEYVGGDAGGYWRHIYSGVTTVYPPMVPQGTPYTAPPPYGAPTLPPDQVSKPTPYTPPVYAPTDPAPSPMPPKITQVPATSTAPVPLQPGGPFDVYTPGDWNAPAPVAPATAPSGVPWLLLLSIAAAAVG